MSSSEQLKFDQKTHFEFGKNWQNYLEKISPDKINIAVEALNHLVGFENIKGKDFLDIGCGSGLHSLSALKLGAKYVESFDFDPHSVEATSSLLAGQWKTANYKVYQGNVLMKPVVQTFDVVYSWGVLHHTGALWEAMEAASGFVKPGGIFAIAIYQKTRLCGPWKLIKRFYKNAPQWLKRMMEGSFSILKKLKLLLQGVNPNRFVDQYEIQRGMTWHNDIVDWLGGYPYESAEPKEIISFVEKQGFSFEKGQRLNTTVPIGLFGSGCGEFVFRRSR